MSGLGAGRPPAQPPPVSPGVPRRSVRRRTLLILAASPVATVAVSWLCAGWLPEPPAQPARTLGGSITGGPPEWGDPIVCVRGRRMGLVVCEESWSLMFLEGEPTLLTFRQAAAIRVAKDLDTFHRQEDVFVTRRRVEAGFPFPAMAWTTVRTPADMDLPDSIRPVGSWPSDGLINLDNFLFQTLQVQPDRRFPAIPLWPGFAANTLVFAAVAWTALVGLPAVRRRRRRARGLCASCAYPVPVPVPAVCPECGAPLAAPAPGA
jgi:hypothetical protein